MSRKSLCDSSAIFDFVHAYLCAWHMVQIHDTLLP